MSQPTPQPSIYQGTHWLNSSSSSSPHVNGGVHNKWFTLLSQGGFQNGTNIVGIGTDKAASIAWENLRTRLGKASNFMDARNGAVDASRAMFGACSNELLQNIKAWRAVGLDAPLPDPIIGSTFNNTYTVCYDDPYTFPFTIASCWFPGTTFTWSFPRSITAISNGDQLVVQSVNWPGTHIVYLTATFEGTTRTVTGIIDATSCGNNYYLKSNQEHNTMFSDKFIIYPNPTSNVVNINLPSKYIDKKYNIQISNILGQVVLAKSIDHFDNRIEMSHFSSGIYQIIIRDMEGELKYLSKIKKN